MVAKLINNPLKLLSGLLLLFFFACDGSGQATETYVKAEPREAQKAPVKTGADNLIENKLHLLKGKKIAVLANHTSLIGGSTHIVDTLLALGIEVKKIFGPEHGFRGDQDAGKKILNGVDEKTGLPVISLYGKNKKPSASQLAELDMVVFDIQDVGARFYTYISTMTYMMEACAENDIRMMVLDRPNPNGWYVDGPVLREDLSSFVGLHSIPIVHGMTLGEYATLLNGEGWLKNEATCLLTVIPCLDYRHVQRWEETGLTWVAPSPNLPTEYTAYLYPMLCWFEGTPVSIGRGTEAPFQQFGAPWHVGYKNAMLRDSILGKEAAGLLRLYGLEMTYHSFIPRSIPGKSTYPKFENQTCYGAKFVNRVEGKELFWAGLSLLQNFYDESQTVNLPEPLFQPFFDKLVGNSILKNQITEGEDPKEIWQGWQKDVNEFKQIRKKYLLYEDFE